MAINQYEEVVADIINASSEKELAKHVKKAMLLIDQLDAVMSKKLFFAFREKIIFFVIEKGILPPFDILSFFHVFKTQIDCVDADPFIDNQLKILKTHLAASQKDSYECFLFVDLIFLLEMVNGKFDIAFQNYLGNMVTSNLFEAYKYPEGHELFIRILQNSMISAQEMIPYLNQILEPENFFDHDSEVQSSILIWVWLVIWVEQQFLASPAFYGIEKSLERSMLKALELNDLSMTMKIYNTAHDILGNLFQTQDEMKRFNDRFTKPMGTLCRQWDKSLPRSASMDNGKKKLAIVRDRFVNNSPFRVEYSLIKMLMSEKKVTDHYEIYLYSVGSLEKDFDDDQIIAMYQKLGVIVKSIPIEWYEKGYYYDPLEKAQIIRKDMIEEGIDILIATVAGNSIVNFLFATRTVPKQIYWSHGNFVYDIEGIDEKITHFALSTNNQNEYKAFLIPHEDEAYNPFIEPNIIEDERSKYPLNCLILGTIGRLVKLNSDEYLETIAEIMDTNPQTIYLACGSGDDRTLKEKVKKLGLEERFYFPGFVDPHVYGHIIDLYLDTFPLPSGESLAEYAGKGKPYVLMMDYDLLSKNLQIEYDKFIKLHGEARPFAFSKKDYIDVATHLLKNSEALEKVTRYIYEEHVNQKPGSSAYYRKEIENYGAKGFLTLIEHSTHKAQQSILQQKQKQEEETAKVRFEELKSKYRLEFESVFIESKVDNGALNFHAMLLDLSSGDIEKRMYYNYFLAEYYSEQKDISQAKIFIERAWVFSRFDPHVLPLYLTIHEAIQDYESIREAYKRAGIEESKKKNIAKAIAYFNHWHYVEATYNQADVYRYDFDIIDAIERMAEPYKFTDKPECKKAEGKRKIAFLIFGITHANSSLVKSNKAYFKHLEMERNHVTIFVIDSKKEVLNSIEAMGHVMEFQRIGCNIQLFEDSYDKANRLLSISKAIHDFGADILLTGAAMAEFEHTFVIATKPAPKIAGFLLGPPEQFCYPFMDEVLGYAFHPLMDSPAQKNEYQPSKYENKKIVFTKSRKDLEIPENAVVLMSAGRHTKFQNISYWNVINEVLIANPHVYYIVAGVEYKQMESYIDVTLRERIKFLGWVNDVQEYLFISDIAIDTYPSGGGYTVADSMRMGLPTIVFENDFTKKFSQNHWSLAYELANISQLTLKRESFVALKELLLKLIYDESWRIEMGKKCQDYFEENLLHKDITSYVFEM